MVNLTTLRSKLLILIVLSIGILAYGAYESYIGLSKIKINLDSIAIQELGLNRSFSQLSNLESRKKVPVQKFLSRLHNKQFITKNDEKVLSKEYIVIREKVLKLSRKLSEIYQEMTLLIVPDSQFAEIAVVSIESFKEESEDIEKEFNEVDLLITSGIKNNKVEIEKKLFELLKKDDRLINSFTAEIDSITRSSREEIVNDYKKTINYSVIAYLAIFIMLSVLISFIFHRILNPLKYVSHIANRLAKGEREVLITTDRKDEVGILLNSMKVMQSSINRYENNILHERDIAIQANKAKTAFLSNINHEMRTPMNVILGLLEEIQENNGQSEYIKKIKDQSSTLIKLIDDVLDLTEVQSGTMKTHNESTDLNNFITQTISRLEHKAISKGVEVTHHYDESLNRKVMIDTVKIRKVINNIFDNAVKFTDVGTIDISTKVFRNEIIIVIEDTGIGLSDEVKANFFKEFVQGENYLTKKYEGLGLGNAVNQKLLKLIGGDINIESRLGEGTTMIVTLPLIFSSEEDGRKELEDIDLKSVRVLAVDDNEENLNLIKIQLSKSVGFIDYAQDGLVALDKFSHDNFDVILMDLQMPEMDGIECVKVIREKEINSSLRRTPIIAVTAYALEAERKKCEVAGFDKFYTKPINKLELIGLIKNVVKDNKKNISV